MSTDSSRALGLTALASALERGEVSSREATSAYLARIAEANPSLRAFITVLDEQALAAATASDQRRKQKRSLGALDGIPIAVKDNIDVAGVPTTGGIAHYRNNHVERDAFVIERLRSAGAVILGKLNMHEGALGATNDNPWFGRCENPRRIGYTPGGSSGGSGAAVAADLCAAALGTDTLGSVRIPAAYCGTAALKPTYGLVSTRGVMPLSWTFDHVGFLAPRVADLRLMLECARGFDASWPHARRDGHGARPPTKAIAELRIGRPREVDAVALDSGVARAYANALRRLSEYGARVVEVDLPGYAWTKLRREGLLISEFEGAVVHAEAMAANPDGFSAEFRAMLAFGAKQPATRAALAYRRIGAARRIVERAFDECDCDALLLPSAPQPAFPFGAPVPVNQADFTAIANISRGPAACVPFGATQDGLPLSVQAITRPFQDELALAVAQSLEDIG